MDRDFNADMAFEEEFSKMFNQGVEQVRQQTGGGKGYDVSDERLREMNKRLPAWNPLSAHLSKDVFSEMASRAVRPHSPALCEEEGEEERDHIR